MNVIPILPAVTDEQRRAINKFTQENSVKWDGKIGRYSNGEVTIDVVFDYDPEQITYKIKFDKVGRIVE